MHRFLSAGRGDQWHGNVAFNFTDQPIVDLAAFALGYWRAGKRLVPHIAKARGYADYDGYPIFYLYRHSLELFLKAAVAKGRQLRYLRGYQVDTDDKLFRQHGLKRLFEPFCAALQAADYQLTGATLEGSGLSSFDDLKTLLEDIDAIDFASQAFRYPVDRDGNVGVLPHHTVFNVITFAASMDSLLGVLEGCVSILSDHFDSTAEAKYESYSE